MVPEVNGKVPAGDSISAFNLWHQQKHQSDPPEPDYELIGTGVEPEWLCIVHIGDQRGTSEADGWSTPATSAR